MQRATSTTAAPGAETSVGQERAMDGWIRARGILLGLLPALVVVALAGWAVLHGQEPYPSARFSYMDQNRYIAMAQHPFAADPLVREPPFALRLLTPLVVHVLVQILPLPTLTAFWLLTVACLIATAYALWWFLEGIGLPRQAALAGTLAFVFLAPATGFTLWDYMLNDPLSFALLAAALGCAVHRRGALLFVALVLGVTNKEVNLLAAVFAVAWALQQRDRVLIAWSLGGAATAAAALVVIHLAVPTTTSSYSLIGQFFGQSVDLAPLALRLRLYQATVFSWTVLLPVAALQLVHPPRIWRSPAFILLLLGATAQFLVATDVERLVVYAFPAVIAATAFEIEYLARRFTISRWWLWTPLLTLQLGWWLVTYYTRPDASTYMSPYPALNEVAKGLAPMTLALVVAFTVLDLIQQIRRGRAQVR